MFEALIGRDPWFAPKRYGYGSGLPIAWQGWALTAVFVAAIIGCGLLIETGQVILGIFCMILFTLAYLLLAKRHTDGGWRWRNGS
ncbi:hypothetical protein [Aurantiacibacter marinus]|uniref:Uncharacterized protein n=1 Tax=Aurantiacibacter marinus TaxID=874156 RepID=A0A0H0XRG6_9SPHN|nr:hypothetical protein [Aurantiacibacter marinus]KLI64596.1 hypothetical protein AAV99_03295 [Aurantiacibacter marinus]